MCREKVSRWAVPKKPLSHSFLDLPNSSMSTHESAPHTMAQMAIAMMSVKLWRLVRQCEGVKGVAVEGLGPLKC